MSGFEDIRLRAEARKGGARALKAMLPTVATKKQLIELGDDRYLAMMTKSINQAGFSWKVIENKWPSFEEAFLGFDPRKLSYLSPEQWEAFTSDKRVVRNWQKIKALQDNVFFVQDESRRSGGFGQFIADWPVEDQIGLMAYLKKHGSRLGGQSALWFLRRVGKDCFIPARDVALCCYAALVSTLPRILRRSEISAKIQAQFNEWHTETGLPYSHLSRIAACSVGDNYL